MSITLPMTKIRDIDPELLDAMIVAIVKWEDSADGPQILAKELYELLFLHTKMEYLHDLVRINAEKVKA